jgi:hypothetical protein
VSNLTQILASNFRLSTILLIGACLECLLVLLVPHLYALTPVVVLLTIRLLDTILVTFGLRKNPYLQDALMKKTTAQVPDVDGEFPSDPAGEKIVSLLLGAKSNHPLGIFAPNYVQTADYMTKMSELLDAEAPGNGCAST